MATVVIASSLAKEAKDFSTVSIGKACTNGGSKEN